MARVWIACMFPSFPPPRPTRTDALIVRLLVSKLSTSCCMITLIALTMLRARMTGLVKTCVSTCGRSMWMCRIASFVEEECERSLAISASSLEPSHVELCESEKEDRCQSASQLAPYVNNGWSVLLERTWLRLHGETYCLNPAHNITSISEVCSTSHRRRINSSPPRLRAV